MCHSWVVEFDFVLFFILNPLKLKNKTQVIRKCSLEKAESAFLSWFLFCCCCCCLNFFICFELFWRWTLICNSGWSWIYNPLCLWPASDCWNYNHAQLALASWFQPRSRGGAREKHSEEKGDEALNFLPTGFPAWYLIIFIFKTRLATAPGFTVFVMTVKWKHIYVTSKHG